MQPSAMPIVSVAGSPRQIGRLTGEALREPIAAHLDILRSLGNLPTDPEAPLWRERLPASIAVMQQLMPALWDEIEGTAEGANQPVAHIAAINMPFYGREFDLDACSNVAFARGPDGPLWGKNNDGGVPGGELPIALRHVRPDHGIPYAAFVFSGWLGFGDGMNAEGLAMGHSSVGSVFQQSDHHVPVRMWAHQGLLSCRTAAEFRRHVASRPLRGKGYAWVIVDRHGDACSLEVPCPLVQVRRGSHAQGHVHCVNYYQLPTLAEADRRRPAEKSHAIERGRMLDRQLADGGDWDVAHMQRLLRYHGKPGMCRHGGHDMSHTNYSAIGIPAAGKLLHVLGTPCSVEYGELDI